MKYINNKVMLLLLLSYFSASIGILNAEPMEQSRTVDSSHPRVRLVLGSDDLYGDIKLVKARVAPIGNFIRGQASVQNLTDENYGLEYKFDWYDDEGFIVGKGGVWQRFMLGAREIRSFKSLGKSKNASRMQLTVRVPVDYFD